MLGVERIAELDGYALKTKRVGYEENSKMCWVRISMYVTFCCGDKRILCGSWRDFISRGNTSGLDKLLILSSLLLE